MKNQSDKKTCPKSVTYSKSGDSFEGFVYSFQSFFQRARHNRTAIASQYIQGLMKLAKGHANMERMEEEIPDSEYRAHQHFITNSEWDYEGVIAKVATDTSHLMKVNKEKSGQPTGLIIDESAHLKKGDKSIGVCPQYAGVVGKVENCQVGVYASLINDNRTTLIDESLFLPAKWAKNRLRCQKAGVLEEHIQFKTKPQLALEMIDRALDLEVAFDWVGGDGLYGHNSELRNGLQSRGLFYVLDVHKDEKVFTERPVLEVPNKSHKRGRPTKKAKPNIDPIRVDQYIKDIKDEEWCIENKIRKTHKGWKKLKVHTCKIWLLQNEQLQELTLLITQTMDGKKETKYSFSNGGIDQYAAKEYAYFQCQRYWVERAFDDAKNELGMSDYQVRKWNGWHHHHALVLMASLYLLIQKIDLQEDAPLISVRDARILMIVRLFGTDKDMQKRLKQMEKRHLKRQFDIDRYYIT